MRWVLALLLVFVVALPAHGVPARPNEMVRVIEPGGMSSETISSVTSAAHQQGGRVAFFHTGTIKLVEVTRADEVIQLAPSGMAFPMASLAFDPAAVEPLYGPELRDVLTAGNVAMGETSARLRGARVGDVVTVIGWDGVRHEFEIGLIADDTEVAYAELVFSDEMAASIGFVRVSSAAVWGYEDEDHLNVLIRLGTDSLLRVTSPHDGPFIDAVLPSAVLKEQLGEFAYRETGRGDWIEIDSAWRAENIVFIDHPLTGRFPCHRVVAPLVESALDEIAAAGIGSLVDRNDFQLAGGCFVPRLIRGGDKGGAISRHAYGAAIDINPSDNRYGGTVSMDIRIVRIFRDLGFAWGGGWTFSDGMHFEYSPSLAPPDDLS